MPRACILYAHRLQSHLSRSFPKGLSSLRSCVSSRISNRVLQRRWQSHSTEEHTAAQIKDGEGSSGSSYRSHTADHFERIVGDPASKYQLYISNYVDVHVNLAIEQYLMQHSSADSTILFIYKNRHTAVIGRNQNPWLETNLWSLWPKSGAGEDRTLGLTRRRSGGGTVYHNLNNMNYSVICPPSEFSRDKHAEMVVAALKRLGVFNAEVNERHDIILGRPYSAVSGLASLKISGSAYKLTRQRALHHGTLLQTLMPPHSLLLRLQSPARPYIKARGVESVRSDVGSLAKYQDASESIMLQLALLAQFGSMYKIPLPKPYPILYPDGPFLHTGDGWVMGRFPKSIPMSRWSRKIEEYSAELKSPEWTFDQTPQFTFSTFPTDEDARERPPLPPDLPPSARVFLKVKQGSIIESKISFSSDASTAEKQEKMISARLQNVKLRDLGDWCAHLKVDGPGQTSADAYAVGVWLNETLPSPALMEKSFNPFIRRQYIGK